MTAVEQEALPDDVLHYRQFARSRANLWIFGYGSLMWDPGFPYVSWAPALIHGYHRAMCISSSRWRGTPQRPGLVLGLDRGGACRGIAFLVAAADVAVTLRKLWAREMRRRIYLPRLLQARLPDKTVRALAFVADPRHAEYSGHLTLEQTAERIANCRGARGPNLEYLVRTIEHLAELGVRDHYLLRVLAAARHAAR
ncbi:MAG: gamma-glutamylcyclotransferase [Pseudomonadota bacterium]